MKPKSIDVFPRGARVLVLAGLALGMALVLVSGGSAQEAPAPADTASRVAVINMDEVLRQSDEWQDAARERAALAERRDRALRPLDRRRRALERAVRDYPIGTADRREAMEAYREKEMEYRQKAAEFDQQMEQQFSTSYRDIVTKIAEASERYARENGIDVVLKTGSPTGLDQQADLMDIHMQQVVYAAPELDISDPIVRMINAGYEAPIQDN
jgi:Skp family chaperone for outer membrane proteins